MSKNTGKGILILVLIAAAFNLIAFTVPFDREKVFWISYGFGMFAILFQAYVFKSADAVNGTAKSRFYGFPIIRVGLCYLAVQIALSLLGMAYDVFVPVWAAVLVFGLLLIAAVFGCSTGWEAEKYRFPYAGTAVHVCCAGEPVCR